MSVSVKICGLTREVDVEVAIDAGADVLGFVFDRGPCFVTLAKAQRLLQVAQSPRDAPSCIAVVGRLPQLDIQAIVDVGFRIVQAVQPAYVAARSTTAQVVVPAFFDGPQLTEQVRAFRQAHRPAYDRFEAPILGCVNIDGRGGGGTGTRADWHVAASLAAEGPIMLAGGLTPENVGQAIDQVQPRAVDVSSGVEASPGVKDAARVRAFVSAAKSP